MVDTVGYCNRSFIQICAEIGSPAAALVVKDVSGEVTIIIPMILSWNIKLK